MYYIYSKIVGSNVYGDKTSCLMRRVAWQDIRKIFSRWFANLNSWLTRYGNYEHSVLIRLNKCLLNIKQKEKFYSRMTNNSGYLR